MQLPLHSGTISALAGCCADAHQFTVAASGRVWLNGHSTKNSGPPTVLARVVFTMIATGRTKILQLVAEPPWLAKPPRLYASQLR